MTSGERDTWIAIVKHGSLTTRHRYATTPTTDGSIGQQPSLIQASLQNTHCPHDWRCIVERPHKANPKKRHHRIVHQWPFCGHVFRCEIHCYLSFRLPNQWNLVIRNHIAWLLSTAQPKHDQPICPAGCSTSRNDLKKGWMG